MKKALVVGAIAVAAALGTVGTATAATSSASPAQNAKPAAAEWVLYEQHISGQQCTTDGQWLLANVSGIYNYWCDSSDNHANDGLYALWAYQND